MSAVRVENLRKTYRIHRKQPGLAGSIRSLVSRKYEDVVAVNGLSFSVAEGELVGFLGPNGAGKTTTLKMLSGLLHPSGGELSVLGHTPFLREYDFLRRISLVMGQKNQLWWDLPAYDGFLLNQEIYGIDRKAADQRIQQLASWLEVSDQLNVQVRKLSLGERMKVELIASLLHQPRVLFLDEPTIGLDVVSQRRIRQFIREYNRNEGTTILLTSHYMNDIAELCERVIVIGKGNLLFDGKLSTLINEHSDERLVRLDFLPERMPSALELSQLATVESFEGGRAQLRIPKARVPEIVGKLLLWQPVDLSVEEVPVDEVVEALFARSEATDA